jgi:hypothetical protein
MRSDIFIIHVVYVFAAILFLFLPLQRSRVRASWSRWAFIALALLLAAMGVLGLASDCGVPLAEVTTQRYYGGVSMVRGVVVGLLLALLLSGELSGKKTLSHEHDT